MDLINRIFTVEKYQSAGQRIQARFMYALLGMLLVVITLLMSAVVLTTQLTVRTTIAPIIVVAVILGTIILVRRGDLQRASWFLSITLFIGISQNAFAGIELPLVSVVNLATMIVMVAFLIGQQGLILVTPLAIAVLWIAPVLPQTIDSSQLFSRVSLTIAYALLAGVLYFYNQFVAASREEGELEEGEERFKLAEINTAITRMGAERTGLKDTLDKTLALILENYPQLYHAQVFLIDRDGVQARLTASTGVIGERLIEKGHSLAVGSLSVIGQTTFKGDHVIASAGDREDVHRENVLLPETRVEAAFPMAVSGQIIGALDLQSRQDLDLSLYDIQTFQSLANSLSLAVDNIRQFEEAQQRILENQRLAEQTRVALRDVERLNQRLIGRAWSEYAAGRGDELAMTLDLHDDTVELETDWTQSLIAAIEADEVVRDEHTVAIPLRVRGQVIGAMEFEMDDNQVLSAEDMELIQEISERFGLAAENLRLVEESQRTAQREALINEISGRFQTAQDVETTLTEAVRSISDTLHADRVKIRLGAPSANGNHGREER